MPFFKNTFMMLLSCSVSRLLAYEQVNVNVTSPQDNAPLNTTLAYYRLPGHNGKSNQLTHGFFMSSCGANISVHYTDPSVYGSATGTPAKPVLLLTHGWPQSSYIWRKITQSMSARVPLFVPDQPGYGLSTPCTTGVDKQTAAAALLGVLHDIYGNSSVVLAGHDRGGRTCHRAAVSNNFTGITPLGVWMADIIPIVEEFKAFQNATISTAYYHWAFLPNSVLATDMIMAYGGGNWVKYNLAHGAGPSVKGLQHFQDGDAWDVYANFANQTSVTNTTAFDYGAAATVDYYAQIEDQTANRKISIPTHVEYSEWNLGQQVNVQQVWSNWTHPSAGLTTKGIGGGAGHFIIEEAPHDTIEQLNTFLDRLKVSSTRL